MPVKPGRGLHRGNFISVAAVVPSIERPNVYHSCLRENFSAVLLRQIKIVLVERVLSAVMATHHAAAAALAGRPLRPLSAEVGIRKRLSARLSFRRLKDGRSEERRV